MDGKTVARRSARNFETDEPIPSNEKIIISDAASTRRKPFAEETKVDTNVPKEVHRHSRQSSISTSSESPMEFQMDLIGSTLSATASEAGHEGMYR